MKRFGSTVNKGVALIFALLISAASAEESVPKQVWEDLKSPWTTSPASSAFWIGSGVTLGLLILEDQIIDPAMRETVEHRPLGSFSKFGDRAGQMYPNGLYALGFGLHSWLAQDADSARRMRIMLKSTLYAGAVATVLKHTVREPRPCYGCKNDSFPSGHSMTAFAFASTVASEHAWYWGALAYGMAGLVGYSRMNDNRHHLQDVAFGATLGISYGLGIYQREKSRASDPGHGGGKDESVLLVPLPETTGAAFVYQRAISL